ncbi:hypothetical protein [Candidatus Mesenet endosymbiont of Phosphuga atrata]|uniref:hypothetical protein n=1 Tax=Candidatus Mesenet endosymbiont of Phosphuga atrata TaxID=3066221 RepID=UPI0030CBD0E8
MNSCILSSVLKRNKGRLVLNGIMITSVAFIGIGLFSKLGKTGFALGIIGFIPLAAFSLFVTAVTVYSASDDIKKHHKISGKTIGIIAAITIPFILNTVLTGIGLFGNELDSNVKSALGFASFVMLLLFELPIILNIINNVKHHDKCMPEALESMERVVSMITRKSTT